MKTPPMAADPAAILTALVQCRSVTPADGGALAYLAALLGDAGFAVERMTFGAPGTPDVENLFATIGAGSPHLAFGGHTDVVPPGDEARWSHPPFAGETVDGVLFGRGAVDMKGGVAAFAAAAIDFVAAGGPPRGTLSFLITGDEEGPGINGTAKLLAFAAERGDRFDAALVGEPTSRRTLGDTIKIGRRGSLSGTIVVSGVQGHVAYPRLADNPLPRLIRLLHRLTEARLDEGSAAFEPSNIEITSIDVGNSAANVIPAEAKARFNIRYNDRWTPVTLTAWLRRELEVAAGGGAYALTIMPGASQSFLTRPGRLTAEISAAIRDVTGIEPEPSTNGGTSDARFFKDLCPVVEFGLVGDTMHQVDERVPVADLLRLTAVYRRFLAIHFDASPG
ncbi:MAG: succinyl-diaminopimelate desuccinylase [Bauldia sp.]